MTNIYEARLGVITCISEVLMDIALDGDESARTSELEDNLRLAAEYIADVLQMEVSEFSNDEVTLKVKIF
jgi:hypothetical protein